MCRTRDKCRNAGRFVESSFAERDTLSGGGGGRQNRGVFDRVQANSTIRAMRQETFRSCESSYAFQMRQNRRDDNLRGPTHQESKC